MNSTVLRSLGLMAVIAAAQLGAAALSPWAALAAGPALGLLCAPAAGLIGLRRANPWMLVGLALLGSLIGVLAAAPMLSEPQEAAAVAPTLAMAAAAARVLIRRLR